jgi:hypothetical protein
MLEFTKPGVWEAAINVAWPRSLTCKLQKDSDSESLFITSHQSQNSESKTCKSGTVPVSQMF